LNKVFKAICEKTRKKEQRITDRAIRYRIDDYQKESKIVSDRLARNAYAYEVMGIDVEPLISPEELEELQDWLNKKPQQPTPVIEREGKKPRIRKIGKKVVDASSLPPNLLEEAIRMAEIYPDVYVIENLVRHVIMSVLEKKYGKDWWQIPNVVSNEIRREVERRKHFERKNRWVAKRRTHEIFYTDFADLSRIIATNSKEFKEIFANLEVEAELRKLEPSRNVIAHNNPLPPKEFERIKLCLGDLKEQLRDFAEKKES
jgi:hypothetical protein